MQSFIEMLKNFNTLITRILCLQGNNANDRKDYAMRTGHMKNNESCSFRKK